ERLGPLDLDEVACAALGSLAPLERLPEAGRRVLLHDPGGALGADHAMIDRMIAIAFDEANAVVLDGDLDAPPASAHVARREVRLLLRAVFRNDFAAHRTDSATIKAVRGA